MLRLAQGHELGVRTTTAAAVTAAPASQQQPSTERANVDVCALRIRRFGVHGILSTAAAAAAAYRNDW